MSASQTGFAASQPSQSATLIHADYPDFDFHEQVVLVSDRASGLQAIVAIHDTTRGPALGGCRMWPYANLREAMTDVLRLSRGMSYKNAVAGLPLGGGKSVIMGDSRKDKTPEKLRALGRAIDQLGGRYVTAEDVGTSPADMDYVREGTRHVAGIAPEHGGLGDPSPMTALGTFVGIRAAVKHKLQRDDLKGLTVSVQGLGHVGWDLCRQLHEAGAKLVVSDMMPQRLDDAKRLFGAQVVGLNEIYAAEADVFAPCALGAIINPQTLPQLKVKIVAGASNNQLSTPDMGDALKSRGILYAPDYVINAGGVIKVCGEYIKSDATRIDGDVRRIEHTLLDIFASADAAHESTHITADRLARERIAQAAKSAKA